MRAAEGCIAVMPGKILPVSSSKLQILSIPQADQRGWWEQYVHWPLHIS